MTRSRLTVIVGRMHFLGSILAVAVLANAVGAQGLFINEIYFNPPNPSRVDETHQYIELRGAPCMPLTNHFLIFVEAEQATAGQIENVFDLGAYALGPNGYLTIRQRSETNAAFNDYAVNPKATNLRNTGSGVGFGSGAGSSIGATNSNASGQETGILEAGGWTAMLIRTDGLEANRPQVMFDLDENNDGLDVPLGPNGAGAHAGWTIVDSVGVFAEEDEAFFGRVYAPLAFGFQPPSVVFGLEPGAQYVQLDWPELEAEYIGRWGNSTGSAPEDWHVANVTNNPLSGFSNTGDFRVSAEPHQSTNPADWESSQGVAYGTALTTTLGSPNYPLNLLTPVPGDFDGDGDVDQADLTEQWEPRFACGDLTGQDFLDWQRNLGAAAGAMPAQASVPEPAAAMLALVAVVVGWGQRRSQRR